MILILTKCYRQKLLSCGYYNVPITLLSLTKNKIDFLMIKIVYIIITKTKKKIKQRNNDVNYDGLILFGDTMVHLWSNFWRQ